MFFDLEVWLALLPRDDLRVWCRASHDLLRLNVRNLCLNTFLVVCHSIFLFLCFYNVSMGGAGAKTSQWFQAEDGDNFP